MIARILDRLFPREEINGHGRCPTYLYRWQIFRRGSWALYVHRFVGEDWSLDLHDHPKRFVSFMVWGGYFEQTASGVREYVAPWLRSFPAAHAHRVFLGPHRECWTLVLVTAQSRPWGFWHDGVWILWRDYVKGEYSHLADKRAVCASFEGGGK